MIQSKRKILAILVVVLCFPALFLMPSQAKAEDIVFIHDFEDGGPDWWADNGTWQIGPPTTGPGSAHSGLECAATVLDGNYANGVRSHLVSPEFVVPPASENPRLRFWHWFSFASGDYGEVHIRVDGGNWEAISERYSHTGSGTWTRPFVDLTPYAGATVEVGFYIYSDGYAAGSGWYVDDITVVTGATPFNNPEDFETGLGDWASTRGTWQVGEVPEGVGPGSAYSGLECAAAVLGGNYANGVRSHLLSPEFMVPSAGENPRLRFWHWFSFASGDYGEVHIKVDGSWESVPLFSNYRGTSSGVWTRPCIDLSAYANSTVQIGFYLYSDGYAASTGWYIDDVEIVTGLVVFNNPEDFETELGDWASTRGTWQVGGVPEGVGPGSAHSGLECAATVLEGNYANGVRSRLASPQFVVPSADQHPRLRFWHWFSLASGDYGEVHIRVDGSEWEVISERYSGSSSGVWTRPRLDLSAYAGLAVEIAFYAYSDGYAASSGWYVDDVEIVTGPEVLNNPEDFESGLGDWFVTRGTWEVGPVPPDVGPGGCHSGTQCAATVLGGNYANGVRSFLVSPEFVVPPASENPRLPFQHWFSFASGDYGEVYIKVDGTWDPDPISQRYSGSSSGVWTRPSLDLSDYAGLRARVGFHLYSDGYASSSGWYIDDIDFPQVCVNPDIEVLPTHLEIPPNTTGQATIVIKNTSCAVTDLYFEICDEEGIGDDCICSEDASWIQEVRPVSGSLAAGGEMLVTVSFDTRGITESVSGNIVITSNDPDEPCVIVQCSSQVDPTIGFCLSNSEGDESVSPVQLELCLSEPAETDVSVEVVSCGGTATPSEDYVILPGPYTIPAGQLRATDPVKVEVMDDTEVEDNETIQLCLTNAVNANVGEFSEYTYTIIDNDPPPSPCIVPYTPDESGNLNIVETSVVGTGDVTVEVEINAALNAVDALGFEVVFNPDCMTFVGGSSADLTADFNFFDCYETASGVITCGGFDAGTGIAQGASGTVARLTFTITAPDFYDPNSALKTDLQNLVDDIETWSTSPGYIRPRCPCDVNGDGRITPEDALCVFQKYLQICPTACGPCAEICGDINQDGETTPADALEVFKAYLGMESLCSGSGSM